MLNLPPEPWKTLKNTTWVDVKDADGFYICQLHGSEQDSLGNLFVHAPETFRALERIIKLWCLNQDRRQEFRDAIDAAREVLKKVRGE